MLKIAVGLGLSLTTIRFVFLQDQDKIWSTRRRSRTGEATFTTYSPTGY